MKKYNYLESVKADVLNYIEEVEETLNEELFACDSVTGNASGSYTFSTWQAEENLCHNLDLLGEALQEFGCDGSYLGKGPEACDVTIRCYLLGSAINEVLNEIIGE